MNKKLIITVLAVICAISILALYTISLNRSKAINNEDNTLINTVVDLEKNLILLQTHNISYDDFKEKAAPFIHSNYSNSYFTELEANINKGSLIALSVIPPVYENISKVYSDENNLNKRIYVRVPLEDTTSEYAKLYLFKKDNEKWKIFSVNNTYLAIDREESKSVIERFTNYDGKPIEYEKNKIYE